ncbi:MAG: c-type cytochrome [Pyrobaculum sp.]
MKWVTVVIIIAVVVIAAVTAITLSGLGATPAHTPTPTPTTATPTPPTTPTTPTAPGTPAPTPGGVKYNAELAQKGVKYFSELGCTACHSVKSLGISGGAVGPDLSKALSSETQWLGKYYKENGLTNPAADPEKAAELLAKYFESPPSYSVTMLAQVQTYKSLYGDDWVKQYVPAFVEMFKMAASR